MSADPLINRITRNLNAALFAIQNLSEDIVELEAENKRLEEENQGLKKPKEEKDVPNPPP